MISPWPLAEIAMLPPIRNAGPPNIFFSLEGRLVEDQYAYAVRENLVNGHDCREDL